MSLVADRLIVKKSGRYILEEVSLTVAAGRVTALIGPNGSGKSTLLRCLAGEEIPRGGGIALDNIDLRQYSHQALAEKRSVMTQSSHIVFDFTVEEVMLMGWVLDAYLTEHQMKKAIDSVVGECGISSIMRRNYRTLSGGEQQRVHFARALLQIWRPTEAEEYRYLLLDEPTSNLDVGYERKMLESIRVIASRGVGVLAVLHDLNLAAHYADEICLLNRGVVKKSGMPSEVMRAEYLSDVYETPIDVVYSEKLDRLIVYTH